MKITIRENGHNIITQNTKFNLESSSLNLIFTENTSQLNMDLDMIKIGVGGLDEEFSVMFRRAFASRMLKPQTVKALEIKHIRGILLYGPPGCGKTLIAKQLCKAINSVEPLVVEGPELLDRYVGVAEERLRKLFEPAEMEYKLMKENSKVHVIVFEEIDAICRKRGTTNSPVNDCLVNQFLAKFDGHSECNNFIIVGTTNRRDIIDDALLRPGRFGLQLKISLPDELGRQQILKIHTNALYENNAISDDVDIERIASVTKNYTGAEIQDLVGAARSFAIQRAMEFDEKSLQNVNESKILITADDFDRALTEIVPKFGLDDEVKTQMSRYGILYYSKGFELFKDTIDSDIKNFIKSQNETMIIFLSGVRGSGRTNLALQIALETKFPCIKYITGQSVIGMMDSQKGNYIKNCFDESTKSSQSVIVCDDMENIIEWIYSREFSRLSYSASVSTTLKSLATYKHPSPVKSTIMRKQLMICTFEIESESVMSELGILPIPNRVYKIPSTESYDKDYNIDVGVQKIIRDIDQKSDGSDHVELDIDTTLPIKKYIFEYNNNQS